MAYNANINGCLFNVPDGSMLTISSDGKVGVDSASSYAFQYHSYSGPGVYTSNPLQVFRDTPSNNTTKEENMTITHVSVEGLMFDVKIDPVSNVSDALASAQSKLKAISGYKSWLLVPTGDTVFTEDRGTLPTKTVRYTDSLNNVHVAGANGKYSLIK